METLVSVGDTSPIRTVRAPANYGSWRPEYHVAPPALGEHTEEVLGELGYARVEIEQLVGSGVARSRALRT
jgi:crotonobetainyl-CoA:carnitine CoA-transferase CaiB-like acyl-CoA transferase